jgi:hypothetical protein
MSDPLFDRPVVRVVAHPALYLALQVVAWYGFFSQSERVGAGPTLIVVYVVVVLIGIVSLVALSRRSFSVARLTLSLANVILLTIGAFATLYWQSGTKSNFTVALTHLDAVYFALGTLSTAGTGSVSATSQTARLIVSAQMALDLVLLLFAAGIVVARWQERLPLRDPQSRIGAGAGPTAE